MEGGFRNSKFEIRNSGIAPRLRDPACAGEFERRKQNHEEAQRGGVIGEELFRYPDLFKVVYG